MYKGELNSYYELTNIHNIIHNAKRRKLNSDRDNLYYK